jgi:hypothetical protein
MAATTVSLPAPVGGWNARDSIAEMDKLDAVTLTNWFPATTECVLRSGYINWSTGLPAQVETLFAYAGAAADKLFGVSNGGIYDCTTAGAVGAAVVSGLSNSRFQYINFATAGGNFLMAVNSADKLRYYDGTTWSADGGTYTITVADTSQWRSMCLFKQRVWAIQQGTLVAWYLPVASIAGAAVKFDLSQFFRLGGNLVACETWTLDAGYGVDDFLVFVSSKGEVLVYQGTDPSSATTWAMKGLWRIGSPVGTRCLMKFRGDLLIICQDGLLPLSGALQSSRVDPKVALSDKIEFATSTAISKYSTNFGWQAFQFPRENQLILNVPIAVGSQQQYVMNTINQSWCNYTGWAANVWELWKDAPYFGGNGVVCQAWSDTSDNGSNISAVGLQAYQYFESPGLIKRYTMSRPIFRSSGTPTVLSSMSVDFDVDSSTASLTYAPASPAGVWDSATWDGTVWASGSLLVYKSWQGAQGIGYAAAPKVQIVCQGLDVRWVSTDIVMERGAVL